MWRPVRQVQRQCTLIILTYNHKLKKIHWVLIMQLAYSYNVQNVSPQIGIRITINRPNNFQFYRFHLYLLPSEENMSSVWCPRQKLYPH